MQTFLTWAALLVTVAGWLIPFIMLFIVPPNRKPSSATAWLLLIFAVPWVGLLVFLLVGSPKLSPRRRELQRQINDYIGAFIAEARADPETAPLVAPPIAERIRPFVELSTALGALPAVAGNAVELITDYDEMLARIAADIDAARRFVHVEFYILIADGATEGVFQAMERAADRGLPVRVLYDPVGSRRYPPYGATLRRLKAGGIIARPMLPIRGAIDFNRPDLRNHRKIVVVDGEIAYTGSLNLVERGYHRRDGIRYDELVARVRGPAADALDAVFRTDWLSETDERLSALGDLDYPMELTRDGEALCQVLPSGSAFANENNLKLFVALIHASRRRLVICNPYFVPDDALMLAVVSAAHRGVHVTLLNSEAQDQFFVAHAQRSYYEQLLRAGVEIRLYKAPTLLHSKTISVDDDIAVIGSSNLDMRSFTLNLEVTLVCYDPGAVRDLRRAEAEYIARSRALSLEEWRARPRLGQLFENIARLMSALL
ncbi:MAG TPA: cardiolipin synthase [Chloroflexaceae bacterium]|nr:cardiolipin synthase [Chloroflexaceae bacterium]